MAKNKNFYALLEAQFRSAGDAPAFVVPGGRTVTYKALSEDVGRMANALTKLGVKPGDRVMAQVEKSIENVVLYLATLKAGAVFNPLNTAYMPAELEYFIDDAEPTVIVMPIGAAGQDRRHGRGQKGAGPADHGGRRLRLDDRLAPSSSRPPTTPLPAPTTIWRACSTRPARPGAPRAPCSRTRTCRPTPRSLHAYWEFQQGRRAAARAADLPHARPVRGPAHGLPQRLARSIG